MAQINIGSVTADDAAGRLLIPIDRVENINVAPGPYHNELNTLKVLEHGIIVLVNNVWTREQKDRPADLNVRHFIFAPDTSDIQMVTCVFHWFALSVCNYARMVGFIRGLELKEFSRSDLLDKSNFKDISEKIGIYVNGIPELKPVVLYRNKIAGHFAITAPHRDDNIATLNLSAMPHIVQDGGKYIAGGMALGVGNSAGFRSSEITPWSLTDVFQSMLPRYWPDVTPATGSNPPLTF